MIGASIYGFVDYKQTSKKKEFKSMYVEEKHETPAIVTSMEIEKPEVKKEILKQTKSSVTKKTVMKKEEVIPGIKPIPADQKLKVTNKDLSSFDEVKFDPSKETPDVKNKKRKKINIELFSRAPLREDRKVKEITPSVIKDAKKIETKEL